MYGLVNQGIRTMVKNGFGEETWQAVLNESGVSDIFEVSTSYPDEETFKLAGAVCKVLELPLADVLIAYGKWWINEYDEMIIATGHSFVQFLSNLDEHHKKISYMMPSLEAPSIKVMNLTEDSFDLHYNSKREGLQPFVFGLVEGLAELYEKRVEIKENIKAKDEFDCDIFHVKYFEL